MVAQIKTWHFFKQNWLSLPYKLLNLDILIATIRAPGQSYLNDAERAMSLLNIGLQHVAIKMGDIPDWLHDKAGALNHCSTPNAIKTPSCGGCTRVDSRSTIDWRSVVVFAVCLCSSRVWEVVPFRCVVTLEIATVVASFIELLLLHDLTIEIFLTSSKDEWGRSSFSGKSNGSFLSNRPQHNYPHLRPHWLFPLCCYCIVISIGCSKQSLTQHHLLDILISNTIIIL